MDSKRDHRGGHRNIYDQIDLEIINSKGPGPEKFKIYGPYIMRNLKSLFSKFLWNMFSPKRFQKMVSRMIIFGIFYSSSLQSKIMAKFESSSHKPFSFVGEQQRYAHIFVE